MSTRLELHIRTGKCDVGVVFVITTNTKYVLCRYKKTRIAGPGNPTGEDIPNGAQTATQSDMGADLDESPGHASEVEAFD
jgi:hypothetical protein